MDQNDLPFSVEGSESRSPGDGLSGEFYDEMDGMADDLAVTSLVDIKEKFHELCKEPSKEHMLQVASHIGQDWQRLARRLMARDDLNARLYDISTTSGTSEDKCFAILELWGNSAKEEEYSLENLFNALENLPRMDILSKFSEYQLEHEVVKDEVIQYGKGCHEDMLQAGSPVPDTNNANDSDVLKNQDSAVLPAPPVNEAKGEVISNECVEVLESQLEEKPAKKGVHLVKNLKMDAKKKLAFRLDPLHPNGNFVKLSKILKVPEQKIKRIEKKQLIENTPAYMLLQSLPEHNAKSTIQSLITHLKGKTMNLCGIAKKIEQSGLLEKPLSQLTEPLKEELAECLMNNNPLLGSWKDLADLYNIPEETIDMMKLKAGAQVFEETCTELMFKTLAGFDESLTMERLAESLDEMPRKDVSNFVREIIQNWGRYSK